MTFYKIYSYMMNVSQISVFFITVPVILLALTFHEVSHGYAAYRMGDSTAKNFGRLSLNPLKHLDIVGALCMLVFHFGWAKPVPINSRNFKNPRKGMAITALAGPVSNFILAFISLLLFYICAALLELIPTESDLPDFLCKFIAYTLLFFQYGTILNVSLGLFNMIPVPPLDGSRVLYVFLPPKYYFGVMKYERYISLALFALLYIGVLDAPLSFLVGKIISGMEFIINLIPFI